MEIFNDVDEKEVGTCDATGGVDSIVFVSNSHWGSSKLVVWNVNCIVVELS